MENKHELENLMRSTMENLRDMIDVNTVIGDTIETADGNYIVPISRVSFGFASGGSEFGTLAKRDDFDKYPFGGGSGAGVSVKPVAFLVIRGDSVKLLPMDYDTTVDRIVDSVPDLLESVKNFFKPNNEQLNNLNDDNYNNL
ncbi:GerW family sporulation protein [Clostridium sp. NSJ-6]|uniref:GerW family sporulation protein n=1 Tax=Clostridium hominis TaxID=2763036 RepID=A0ABR7D851_9CLOT|nr:GerW family sporulation protein [Clostridium hominis]MBC5627549.1 GerW family sporulation protein [Clostridium hominis]MDU2672608.1 GerW family sporulation protein [Clostridium sp.]